MREDYMIPIHLGILHLLDHQVKMRVKVLVKVTY